MTPEERAAFEQAHLVSTEKVFDGHVFTVEKVTFASETQNYTRAIVRHPGAVVIVPIDDEGNIILVKQWRRASGKIMTELPAGTLEVGEDPAFCATRELQEEIGYKPGKLLRIGGFYSAPGFCSEYLTLFLAQNLQPSKLNPDATEDIEIIRLTVNQALARIKDGTICDAKSVAGILQYKLWY